MSCNKKSWTKYLVYLQISDGNICLHYSLYNFISLSSLKNVGIRIRQIAARHSLRPLTKSYSQLI